MKKNIEETENTAVLAENTRPYLGWMIDWVKAEGETATEGRVLFEVLEIKDAMSRFYAEYVGCEIRAIARDYDFVCEKRNQ